MKKIINQKYNTMRVYKSPIGLEVYKNDWIDGVGYTISGNVSSEHTVKKFDSAYDFERWVRKNISCKTIEFDSEFCQFYAYAKSRRDAMAFAKRIEKLCKKVQEMFKIY